MEKEEKMKLFYGWHIVWAGMLCVLACLGLGRFALGMLLPSMGEESGLGYSRMGLLSTMNFVGYLAAVLFCSPLCRRFGFRAVIFCALFIIGVTMLAIGRLDNFFLVCALYTLTGMGSGGANVPIMALVSSWFRKSHRGRATGFVVIGSGFAILLSGKLIPFLNTIAGDAGWRLGWQVLGVIVLVIACICLAVLRNSPAELGLGPLGTNPTLAPTGFKRRIGKGRLLHLGAIYFCFGFTYVIYATFIVTTLVREHGFSEAQAGNFWALVGLFSLLSGPIFGTLSDKIGRGYALALVFAIQSISYLLVAFSLPAVFLYLSIGCFGIVAWSIPSIMASVVGDLAGPEHAARIFGLVTFVFGLGQIAGPALAGRLAEQSGSFMGSFLMAGICTIVAALLSLLLRPEQ
jgi:MFS family permease